MHRRFAMLRTHRATESLSEEEGSMMSAVNSPPEFGGECAFAVSLGKSAKGKEGCYAIRDGRTYLFLNPVARFLFRILPGRLQAAERHWSSRSTSPRA
jgi:hypothetical protein